jgi:hypothetical protein
MKQVTRVRMAFTLSLLVARTTHAQALVADETSLVNQYIAHHDVERRPSWWNALGRQLALSVDIPPEQVSPVAVQNIIFFATNHRSRIRLDDAVPGLRAVYEQHAEESMRIMAVVALHAIGSRAAMRALRKTLPDEPSERVRKMAMAAVKSYTRANPLALSMRARD